MVHNTCIGNLTYITYINTVEPLLRGHPLEKSLDDGNLNT